MNGYHFIIALSFTGLNDSIYDYIAVSSGSKEEDLDKLKVFYLRDTEYSIYLFGCS